MSSASINPGVRKALACPNCQKAWNVRPEMAGKKARCGKCQNVLRIPAALFAQVIGRESRIPAVSPSATKKASAKTNIPGLRLTGFALLIQAWGLLALTITMITVTALAFVSPETVMAHQMVFNVISWATAGIVLAGFLMSAFVPKSTETRSLVVTSIVCWVMQIALSVATWYVMDQYGGPEMGIIMLMAGSVVFMWACALVYVVFLRALARFMGRSDIAAMARTLLIVEWLVCGLMVAFFALGLLGVEKIVSVILALVLGFSGLVALVLLLIVLFKLGGALRSQV
ncbi:MAG: hypothetical protein ACR2NP_07905 [Pirellulaceae bacterium]